MNNSATTRRISKIALEYNGNDKGMAVAAASNFLLSSKEEEQYEEMKLIADRNSKVKKWALTGYISPPGDVGKKLSDSELTSIAIEALKKVGVTNQNQFRLDIHHSTKQKHIHFIVNRIDINGKCTVQAHNVGSKFGEAVRQVCQERNLKTDVEIGIEKKAIMLNNLTESIKSVNNFDSLILQMKEKGFDVQLSTNIKDGISGMRIVMEKDKNFQTERIYKGGYKLSEISNQLKISEIKSLFEIKNAVREANNNTSGWKEFQEELHRKRFSAMIQYKGEFRPDQKNEVKDIWIQKFIDNRQKNGFFLNKYRGFPLSAIDSEFQDLIKVITGKSTVGNPCHHSKSTKENIVEIASNLMEDFLQPNFVTEDENRFRKKKRKSR